MYIWNFKRNIFYKFWYNFIIHLTVFFVFIFFAFFKTSFNNILIFFSIKLQRNKPDEKLIKRALRLIDSYINISGSNSYYLESINTEKPYNIPASRFLRPVSKRLSKFENIRKKRIIKSLKQAALNQQVFHLWWHPHNFGVNIDKNIKFLENILSVF